MATLTLKRLLTGVIPATVLFSLLLVSLYLLNSSTRELNRVVTSTAGIGHSFELIVLVNMFAVFILTILIVANIIRLVRQYRRNVSGSRLTVRMVILFMVLSVIPVTLVFYFSFQLLNLDIDKQSKTQLNLAVNNALKLGRESLDLRKREMLKRTRDIARSLSDLKTGDSLKLDELRDNYEAAELMVVEGSKIIAYSSADPDGKPVFPSEGLILQLKRNLSYVRLDPTGDSGLEVKVAVTIQPQSTTPTLKAGGEERYLIASFAITKRIDRLAKAVEQAASNYSSRKHLRRTLKMSYLLTLGLVLLLSLTVAIWAAFISTRRLVKPITELASATRAVADGHYDKQIRTKPDDELGFLVDSFNEMTRRIAKASKSAQTSQHQAEEQRAYLQAVLSNLTSGVMTVDRDNILRITNAEAGEMLGVDLNDYIDQSLEELGSEHDYLHGFVDELLPHLSVDELEWRSEVTLFTREGRKILLCRGTTLIDEEGEFGDHIIVIDDVTALLQAQRDAAWGEVARRLAHEIKNPLTPIQLSAERIRRKYLGEMNQEEADLLDRSTHTIIQQVQAMQEMVNAFSEYARAPKLELTELDLNSLIREVVDLYSVSQKDLEIDLELEDDLPTIEADNGRMRQLIHNLVKNGLEAMERKSRKRIDVATRLSSDHSNNYIEVSIRDYGAGFPEDARGQHFEPYFTTKPKGTGLGLAIVKRIVEEHNGIVWADNVKPPGARITIRIPVYSFKTSEDETAHSMQLSESS